MITINNLSKNYGPKVLFKDITLTVNRGEKIGLVGPNGAGKSTLFSLVLKEVEPSGGSVQVKSGLRIGYLPQESSFKSGRTVLAELIEGDPTIIRLKAEKENLEEKNEAGSQRYGEILQKLEVLGYFELGHKAKKILMGLGFKERDFDRALSQMSGGWQMRTLLAKLLTHHYDLLLLDEPTNYLDLNAALWFKDFLEDYQGTFMMISHDKAYLSEVTNYTLILENGAIFKVRGSYEQYERIREEKRTYLAKQLKEQKKKRQQLEKFISRFHAQPNRAAAVRAKRTAIERMGEIELPPDPRESIRNFRFPPTRRSGWRVAELKNISKAYGDIRVYKDFDFEINQGEKAVLAGENGAGKSTLLKILAGAVDIDAGERILGHHVDIGYFSQTRMDVLSPENTVLKEAYSSASGYMPEETIRTILAAFLFTGDDADKKVSVLSGGEKSRLILAKLLINPPNFLLLDEPTTHLDVDAVEALVAALSEYEGTIVFISHDIYFVRSLANAVYEVKSGQVRKFPGSFEYYLEKKDEAGAVPQQPVRAKAKPPKTDKREEEEKKEARDKQPLFEEKQKRQEHNQPIFNKINRLSKEKERLGLEIYAKSRMVDNPRTPREPETIEGYKNRLKEIEKRLLDIEEELQRLKAQLI